MIDQGRDTDRPAEDGEPLPDLLAPSAFPHPPWTVGVVLVIGVVMLILGVVGHPLWLLMGSPFILTLLVWAVVRTVIWRRERAGELPVDGGANPPAP